MGKCEPDERRDRHRSAENQRQAWPHRAHEPPGDHAEHDHHHGRRQQEQAPLRDRAHRTRNQSTSGARRAAGCRMNDPNIPAPSRSAARFVVQTPRSRIIRMSTSGSRLAARPHPRRAQSRPTPRRDRACAREPQPHERPSLIGSRSATSQPASSTAPSQLTRPGARIGDSGTTRNVADRRDRRRRRTGTRTASGS